MKRIVISVTNDITTDQRVLKVANTMHRNGYDVLIVGRELPNSLPIPEGIKCKRMGLIFKRGALFYAEYNLRLFCFLLFQKVEILLSNDTDTLLANFFASKIKNVKLLFDAHELFPELPELVNRPTIRAVWESIEKLIFPHIKYSYTVCESIARHYQLKYGIKMTVIRNVPSARSTVDKEIVRKNEKIIIYQGALNKGRGLEWVLEAMPMINNAKLLIVGDGDIKNKLVLMTEQLHLNQKVEFIGKVPAVELISYTSQADIGLCLLENMGLSYYYSLPNRIFDYMHAGVPVLATKFPEIESIVDTYHTGILINHYEPEYLAKIINDILNNPPDTQHFNQISHLLCWENEEKKLTELLKKME